MSSRLNVKVIKLVLQSQKQCCGSKFIFFLFGSTIFSDSDKDPNIKILARNLLKWCLSLLSCVLWNLYDRGKSFPTEIYTIFSHSSVGYAIVHKKIFVLQQCLDPNSNFFCRIWVWAGFFSDSDPQHWPEEAASKCSGMKGI
jgi:hypothetical protein